MGQIGIRPNKSTAKEWKAVLEAADIQRGDVVVMDPFCVVAWKDAREDIPIINAEPHLNVPYVPELRDNTELREAMWAVTTLLNRIRAEVIFIILPPHPRYITAPCCASHMLGWNQASSPEAYFGDIKIIDEQLAGGLRGIANAVYLTLDGLSRAIGCLRKSPLDNWKGMVNSTGIFLNNMTMKKLLLQVIIPKGTDRVQLDYLQYIMQEREDLHRRLVDDLTDQAREELEKEHHEVQRSSLHGPRSDTGRPTNIPQSPRGREGNSKSQNYARRM